eukprot:superscaffoldBa00004142_g18351
MSTIQLLRSFVSQRLTVAVEEIIGMFERTITVYEEEIDRHRRLLGAEQLPAIKIALNTETGTNEGNPHANPNGGGLEECRQEGTFSVVLLTLMDADYRCLPVDVGGSGSNSDGGIFANSSLGQALQAGTLNVLAPCPLPSARVSQDIRPLIVSAEIPPEQQEWSSTLDQEDPEPPCIKEEQEEVWSSQEGEQLQGLEKADIPEFPLPPVTVKSEDDEENPQSSQLHHKQTEEYREADPPANSSPQKMEAEAVGEDCGGSESAFDLDVAGFLKAASDGDKTLHKEVRSIMTVPSH